MTSEYGRLATREADEKIIGGDNIRSLNNGEGDPDCIYIDTEADWKQFQLFLTGIPEPTIWQALNALTVWEMRLWMVMRLIYGAPAVGFLFLGR